MKQFATLSTLLGLAALLVMGGCDRNSRPDPASETPSAVGSSEASAGESGAATNATGPTAMAGADGVEGDPTARPAPALGSTIELPDEEWKSLLTDEQFHILREEGTERAFSGRLLKVKEPGTWHCSGCNAPLFETKTKFKSGTGWPSFYEGIEGRVGEKEDRKFGMVRTEVHCAACGGHLGHVFPDGPEPTGLRYCINSVSLNFRPDSLPAPPEGVAPELNPTQ